MILVIFSAYHNLETWVKFSPYLFSLSSTLLVNPLRLFSLFIVLRSSLTRLRPLITKVYNGQMISNHVMKCATTNLTRNCFPWRVLTSFFSSFACSSIIRLYKVVWSKVPPSTVKIQSISAKLCRVWSCITLLKWTAVCAELWQIACYCP